MAKITINGKEIEVQDGTLVIEAAAQAGFEIPHYCYHPDLPVDGNCRMCLVEIEKMPKLTPACTTVASEGMVIHSQTDKVKEAVRGVLEFLLINHPVDCPVCDQAGECRLQDYYMVYGLHTSRIPLELKVRKRKVIDLGPMVVLDQERCVLCSRCIRFFDHVTHTGELQFFGRGDHVAIGTFEDQPLDNPYSGNVADVCPVGALTSRDFRFKCRVWFLHSTDSVCAGCSTACNIRIDHRDGTIFRLLPRRNIEVNRSWMCDEGRLSFHELWKSERLTRPTIKGPDGMHAPVTWEEAISSVDGRLREIGGNGGGGSILGFGSPSATNEGLFLFKRYLADRHGVSTFEFRLADEDKKVNQPEDGVLRRMDKHPNTMGAIKLGLISEELRGIEGAIEAASRGRIKAGVLIYLRPLVSRPDDVEAEARIAQLIDLLEFSVVLTASKGEWLSGASVLMPITTWAEEEGTYTNFQGRVQTAGKAISPAGDIMPLWEVFASLLYASGETTLWLSADEVFNGLAEIVPEYRGAALSQETTEALPTS